MPPADDDTLAKLTRRVLQHRDERDWGQFHTPKELAISLTVESAELLALLQWHRPGEELDRAVVARHGQLREELADVLHSVLLLANDLKIDLAEALEQKLQKDAKKYPIEKAKGRASKYDEL